MQIVELIYHAESDCYLWDVMTDELADQLCVPVAHMDNAAWHYAEAERRGDTEPPPIPEDDDAPPPLPGYGPRFLSKCDDAGCGKIYPGDLIKCPHCGAGCEFSSAVEVDAALWGWDIETYPNVCTFLFIHIGTGVEKLFEVSDRRNDWAALVEFVKYLATSGASLIGFNSIGFDYEVLHDVITKCLNTCRQIYNKAMSIINRPYGERGFTVWESDWLVDNIDLFKIRHYDNPNKSTSLKAIEIAMRSQTVVDLPYPVGTDLTDPQKDVLIVYNRHDVKETIKFAARTQSEMALRAALSVRYDVNMSNYSNTKIGSTILIQEMEAAGIQCYERSDSGRRQPRQTFRAVIRLGEVIFPYVKFERPEFNQALDYFRKTQITETKGAFNDLNIEVDGFIFVFGLGGIHGSIEAQTVVSDADYQIVDIDVESFYPRMAIVNGMYPAHLGAQYCATYQSVFEQRKSFPKGSPENLALKEALNASYGNSNNKYSPLYDPFYTMQTTINGQLLLCMLAEQLMKIPGLTMVQANTDGLTIRCPRNYLAHARSVCKWWEDKTQLKLEEALYTHMFIRDVNNYIAVYEGGKVKRKGAYEYETLFHQDPSMQIVARAAEPVLVHGACLATYIVSHTDPFDFMLRAKVGRSDRLVLRRNGVEEDWQKTTRYFASLNGGTLHKIMPAKEQPGTWKRKPKVTDREFARVMQEIRGLKGDIDAAGTPWDARIHTGNKSKYDIRDTGICSGYLVSQCADVGDFDWSDLDYSFYIDEASKLIDPLTKGIYT